MGFQEIQFLIALIFIFSVVYCAQSNMQIYVVAAHLMVNKLQWFHIDKVGNGHNLVGMKQT